MVSPNPTFRTHPFTILLSLGALCSTVCITARAQGPEYTVRELGPPAYTNASHLSRAMAINARGDVVGYALDGDGIERAARWVHGSTAAQILPIGSNTESIARGINALGTIVGYLYRPGVGYKGWAISADFLVYRGYNFPGIPGDSFGTGINDWNHLTGYAVRPSNYQAGTWVFPSGPAFTALEPSLGEFAESYGEAINNYGQIAGYKRAEVGIPYQGFLWTPDTSNGLYGTSRDITPGQFTVPRALNDLGQVVGNLNSDNSSHGFLWEDGLLTQLTFPPVAGSAALAINNDSRIVGYVSENNSEYAFVWDYVSGIQNLNDLISSNSDVWLQYARGINDAGQIAVAGTNAQGFSRAYLLTPAPSQKIASLTLDRYEVTGQTATVTGTVTLALAAAAGGVDVELSSGDTAVATVSAATVHIPQGTSQTTFTISTLPVPLDTSVAISGTLNASAQAASLTVLSPAPTAMTIVPHTITGGVTPFPEAEVTLSGPAPADFSLFLTSSDATAASVPVTVDVAEGESSTTFTITTLAVRTTRTATIEVANAQQDVYPSALTVVPPELVSMQLSPNPIRIGHASTASIALDGPAPSGGWSVQLTSSSPSVAGVPSSITVSEGATQGAFSVQGIAPGSATVAATDELASTVQSGITVLDYVLTTLSISPTSVFGTGKSTGTVTIDFLAPAAGVLVSLSSNNSAANPGATVIVPPGQTVASFVINTSAVPNDVNATITATRGSTGQSTALLVKAPVLTGITLNPTVVASNATFVLTARITSPAPAGGATVLLTVPSQQKKLVPVPKSITIPAGGTSAGVAIKVGATTGPNKVVPITASYRGTSRTANLTVTP